MHNRCTMHGLVVNGNCVEVVGGRTDSIENAKASVDYVLGLPGAFDADCGTRIRSLFQPFSFVSPTDAIERLVVIHVSDTIVAPRDHSRCIPSLRIERTLCGWKSSDADAAALQVLEARGTELYWQLEGFCPEDEVHGRESLTDDWCFMLRDGCSIET